LRLRSIHDHQVIANGIEIIEVPSRKVLQNVSNSCAMLVEDLIAKLLDPLEILLAPGHADFERTDSAKRRAGRFDGPEDACSDEAPRYPCGWTADLLPLGQVSGDQFRTSKSIDPHLRPKFNPAIPAGFSAYGNRQLLLNAQTAGQPRADL
jgi:hypothetical protein